MFKHLLALGATLAISLGMASSAQADYFLSKSEAQYWARDYVDEELGNTHWLDLSARCRPQGYASAQRGYVYHSWVCRWWDDGDNTTGRVLIKGSNRYDYWWRKLNG